MKKIAGVFLLSTVISVPAFAADQGAYVAVDLGKVNYSDTGTVTPPSPGSIRFSGGYHFSPNVGVEAGYSTIGDSTTNIYGAGWSQSETLKASSLNIAAVGTYSINDKFDLFGKLGAVNTKLDYTFSGVALTPSSGSGSGTKTNLLIGIGAQYNINKHFGIRAQYEDFGKTKVPVVYNNGATATGEFGLKVVSVGGVYNF
jgi:OmpA-OmpF porin, OOP family